MGWALPCQSLRKCSVDLFTAQSHEVIPFKWGLHLSDDIELAKTLSKCAAAPTHHSLFQKKKKKDNKDLYLSYGGSKFQIRTRADQVPWLSHHHRWVSSYMPHVVKRIPLFVSFLLFGGVFLFFKTGFLTWWRIFLFSFLPFLILFFETGTLVTVLAVLELSLYTRLSSHSSYF